MEYHVPDERWAIFGMPDFDNYCERMVVKGLFHPAVPKDIIDAYQVVEYIMAHSYYHYPLYEEAFSKLLLIFEMAIKQKCGQMDIALNNITINKKTQEKVVSDKKLKTLIDELSVKIDMKDIEHQLHALRIIRNIKMHPTTNGLSGGMSYMLIKASVVLLNQLFLNEQYTKSLQQKAGEMQRIINCFKNGVFVLERDNKKYLIWGINISDSVEVKGHWFHLLVCYPVITQIGKLLQEKNHLPLFNFAIDNLVFEINKLEAIEFKSQKNIKIYPTENPMDLAVYSNYSNEMDKINDEDKIVYNQQINHEINSDGTEFLYKWLWMVE